MCAKRFQKFYYLVKGLKQQPHYETVLSSEDDKFYAFKLAAVADKLCWICGRNYIEFVLLIC